MKTDPHLKHPLVSILPLTHPTGAAETLNNCANLLLLFADLFGGDTEKYAILDGDQSRLAMHTQLLSMAGVLEAVSDALTIETAKASP